MKRVFLLKIAFFCACFQVWAGLQQVLTVNRVVHITELPSGEKKVEARILISGDVQTGFLKISESVKGAQSLKFSGKLNREVATFKNDTSLVWIFPDIPAEKEIQYSFIVSDTVVSIRGIWISEKNPGCNHCMVLNDTAWSYKTEKSVAEASRKTTQETETSAGKPGLSTLADVLDCSYRVQVSASVNKQNIQSLTGRLPAGGTMNEERIDQWYKYTTGCFSSVSEAAQYASELESLGFKKPFIVKYVNGVRYR